MGQETVELIEIIYFTHWCCQTAPFSKDATFMEIKNKDMLLDTFNWKYIIKTTKIWNVNNRADSC